jgi:hypothetical protein
MTAYRWRGLAAALLLLPAMAAAQSTGQSPGQTPSPASNAITAPAQKTIGVPSQRQYSTALIVLNAGGARLEGGNLVLEGVMPSATLFTSRPVRTVGHMVTPDMVKIWQTGSFAKDPPNATVSVFAKDGSSVSDAVVVLETASLAGDRLTFKVRLLEGDLGKADGPASVFIDTIWFGVGSNGVSYYGTSDTGNTGGITPNVGDPNGTSSFTGWSNPSPTAPYRPTYNNYERSIGAPPPPDIDPRYRQNYNAPTCGKPPLLPCY